MTVVEYNKKNNTNVEVPVGFQHEFESALMDARRVTDPNDFVQHSFTNMARRRGGRRSGGRRSGGRVSGGLRKGPGLSGKKAGRTYTQWTPSRIKGSVKKPRGTVPGALRNKGRSGHVEDLSKHAAGIGAYSAIQPPPPPPPPPPEETDPTLENIQKTIIKLHDIVDSVNTNNVIQKNAEYKAIKITTHKWLSADEDKFLKEDGGLVEGPYKNSLEQLGKIANEALGLLAQLTENVEDVVEETLSDRADEIAKNEQLSGQSLQEAVETVREESPGLKYDGSRMNEGDVEQELKRIINAPNKPSLEQNRETLNEIVEMYANLRDENAGGRTKALYDRADRVLRTAFEIAFGGDVPKSLRLGRRASEPNLSSQRRPWSQSRASTSTYDRIAVLPEENEDMQKKSEQDIKARSGAALKAAEKVIADAKQATEDAADEEAADEEAPDEAAEEADEEAAAARKKADILERLRNIRKNQDGRETNTTGTVTTRIKAAEKKIESLNLGNNPEIQAALAAAKKVRKEMDDPPANAPVKTKKPDEKKEKKEKPKRSGQGGRMGTRSNPNRVQEEADLDAFLDDYEEDVTYEEVAPGDDTFDEELEAFLASSDDESPPAAAPKKKSVTYANEPSLDSRIDSFLSEVAQDSETFARDRAHVIHFATASGSLKSQLMKGRDRYLERLSAFLEGDKTVKVRMMDNSEVLVSSLRPNRSSLRSMLKEKAGAPRYCKCD
jgi:hypothetical protein